MIDIYKKDYEQLKYDLQIFLENLADSAGVGVIAESGIIEIILEFAFPGNTSIEHDDYFELLIDPVSKMLENVFKKKG